jgi:hypothetical protein
MKKILVVTSYFAPQNIIGAIRITKIFKYVKHELGIEIDIVHLIDQIVEHKDYYLEKDLGNFNLKKVYSTYMTNYLRKFKRNIGKKLNFSFKKPASVSTSNLGINNDSRILSLISHIFELILVRIDVFFYYKKVINLYSMDEYEFLFSSYSPMQSHLVAKKLKKKCPNLIWIADFRDPVFQYNTPFFLRNYYKSFVSIHCHNANLVTYPSTGYVEYLNIPSNISHALIRNGFDSEDILDIDLNKNFKIPFLVISLIGSYYPRVSIRPLFEAIQNLVVSNCVNPDLIKFVYVGSETERMSNDIISYNNSNINSTVESVLPRKEILERYYSETDISINLSHSNKDFNDNLTGKLFELLMIQKPIISLAFGDGDHSELKGILNKIPSATLFEEESYEKDIKQIMSVILEIYNNKFSQNSNYSDKKNIYSIYSDYDYINIAKNLISVIDKL